MKPAANSGSTGLAATMANTTATGLSFVAAVAAGLAATCCVLPVALTILGLGGSWLTFLGFFAANRSYVLAIGLIFLAATAFLMWRQHQCCSKTGQKQHASYFGRSILVLSALLLIGAISTPLWERGATLYLWNLWLDR
jgi:mercuric ion transport protein